MRESNGFRLHPCLEECTILDKSKERYTSSAYLNKCAQAELLVASQKGRKNKILKLYRAWPGRAAPRAAMAPKGRRAGGRAGRGEPSRGEGARLFVGTHLSLATLRRCTAPTIETIENRGIPLLSFLSVLTVKSAGLVYEILRCTQKHLKTLTLKNNCCEGHEYNITIFFRFKYRVIGFA